MRMLNFVGSKPQAIFVLLFALGCNGSQPSAPPPKGGVRNEKVSYEPKPNPLATVVSLGEVLLVEDQPIAILPERLATMKAHETLAVEGVIIHPDSRMGNGAVTGKLLIPNSKAKGGYVIANQGAVIATGKDGRLTYRAEVRVPDEGPQQYTLRMEFSGMRTVPGVGEEPEPWTFPFAEGVLKVARPPKPR
jgi:hypothetical protein